MLVRVWASSELMEPTGSTANFSWNHLSGLVNLSMLLGLSPWFLALPPPPPSPPRYIHKAWRYQEVTVGTEGYFVPSWLAEYRVESTLVLHLDTVWPLTTVLDFYNDLSCLLERVKSNQESNSHFKPDKGNDCIDWYSMSWNIILM